MASDAETENAANPVDSRRLGCWTRPNTCHARRHWNSPSYRPAAGFNCVERTSDYLTFVWS